MPTLSWLSVDFVRHLLLVEGKTIQDAAIHLALCYPDKNGLSVRNLKRFMHENGILIQQRLTKEELEAAVLRATEEVGGAYGRKTMKGYLRANNVCASEMRIREAQAAVAAPYQENRRHDMQKQVNPSAYYAPYFGYNLHIDQNEKCQMFGIVIVMAVDGRSNYITSAAVMPHKNNATIYAHVYSVAVLLFGLFCQLIADKGKEFFLIEFIQEYLRVFRVDAETGLLSTRDPFRQTTSTQNNRIERGWVEVNQKVCYPIKHALIELELIGDLDRRDLAHMFAAGTVGRRVATLMLQRCIDAWNNHPIPSKGMPISHIASRRNYALPADALPTVEAAVQMYHDCGGHLTDETEFGEDPLHDHPEQQMQRDQRFWAEVDAELGGVAGLANGLANHYYWPFQRAVCRFIVLSRPQNAQ